MSICPGIDNNAIIIKTDLVNFIDHFSFDIGLKMINSDVGEFFAEIEDILFNWLIAVNMLLPKPRQIDIRAVYNLDFGFLTYFWIHRF